MESVFSRVIKKKSESKLTWNEIARKAHIGLSSWMCGVPYAKPSDKELRKIAPVLNTTFEYLKFGDGEKE